MKELFTSLLVALPLAVATGCTLGQESLPTPVRDLRQFGGSDVELLVSRTEYKVWVTQDDVEICLVVAAPDGITVAEDDWDQLAKEDIALSAFCEPQLEDKGLWSVLRVADPPLEVAVNLFPTAFASDWNVDVQPDLPLQRLERALVVEATDFEGPVEIQIVQSKDASLVHTYTFDAAGVGLE